MGIFPAFWLVIEIETLPTLENFTWQPIKYKKSISTRNGFWKNSDDNCSISQYIDGVHKCMHCFTYWSILTREYSFIWSALLSSHYLIEIVQYVMHSSAVTDR